jgi:hypothetical protein
LEAKPCDKKSGDVVSCAKSIYENVKLVGTLGFSKVSKAPSHFRLIATTPTKTNIGLIGTPENCELSVACMKFNKKKFYFWRTPLHLDECAMV